MILQTKSKIRIEISLENGTNFLLSILLYADDIVLIAANENDLQVLIFIVETWCKKWRLELNLTKTNVMHVRQKRKCQSKFWFIFDKKTVPYCENYKYFGTTINQFLDFEVTK